MSRRRGWASPLRATRAVLGPALAIGAILAAPATAAGAVTFGSDLDRVPTLNTNCAVPCSTANASLIGRRALNSPATGTLTSFSVRSGSTGSVSLRILRPVGGGAFTGAGTSGLVAIGTGITGPIPVTLPIQSGDAIGLDNPGAHLVLAANPRAAQVYWTPPLADGSTQAGLVASGLETMVQATVEPSNELDFGKVDRNKKKGSAEFEVEVPNRGTLEVSGKNLGLKVEGGEGMIPDPGQITVRVNARGKKRRNLERRGKVKVRPVFTYTPRSGLTNEQARKLKLIKK